MEALRRARKDVVRSLSALAVSGDAFLLESDGGVILVDGGRSASLLADALVKHRPDLRLIDIVVCSHADEDHAEGLIVFPAAWSEACGHKVTIREFWLPGRWRPVVQEGLRDPKKLVDAIINDIDRLSIEHPGMRHGAAEDIELSILGDETGDMEDHGSNPEPRGVEALQLAGVSVSMKVRRTVARDEGTGPLRDGNLPLLSVEGEDLKVSRREMSADAQDVRADEMSRTTSRPLLRHGRLTARPDHDGNDWFAEPETSKEPEWLKDLEDRAQGVLHDDGNWMHRFRLGHRRIDYRDRERSALPGGRPSAAIAIGPQAAALWHALIDTATRIGRVAATAIAHDSRIRWFDQEEFEETGIRRGGRPGVLLPMNSCEQRRPPAPTMPEDAIVYMLTISKANRKSLVFYAPPKIPSVFGVVFAADTALTWGYGDHWELPAFPRMGTSHAIATAPHHGSEKNAIAYAHGRKYYGVQGWLRGHNGGSIGSTFKALTWRACTECPDHLPVPHARRSVELLLGAPRWCTMKYHCVCS